MSSPQLKLYYYVHNQRKKIEDCGNYGKMSYEDIKRLDRYIPNNIFRDDDSCCIYNGEVKTNYCTMSFRSKKISVLRLLYHNYIDHINKSDTIEYLCENNGICCKLSHFKVKDKPEVDVAYSYKPPTNSPFRDDDDDIFAFDD